MRLAPTQLETRFKLALKVLRDAEGEDDLWIGAFLERYEDTVQTNERALGLETIDTLIDAGAIRKRDPIAKLRRFLAERLPRLH